MGCDIHWVLEQRVADKWIGLSCSRVTYEKATRRWYQFFTELGLPYRGESKTAVELNGFPADASDLSKYEYSRTEGDNHSDSHLPVKDFYDAFKRAEEASPFVDEKTACKNAGELFGQYCWFDSEDLDQCRVVFWFDN